MLLFFVLLYILFYAGFVFCFCLVVLFWVWNG